MSVRACVIKAHPGGLGSLLNKVITCSFLYDYLHVDWSEGCFYGNIWPVLFEPNDHPEKLGLEFDTIGEPPNYDITGPGAGHLYEGAVFPGWRAKCHAEWQKLPLRPFLAREATLYCRDLPDAFTAILVRSVGHCREQLTSLPQDLGQYLGAIEKVIDAGGPRNLFVMASDTVALHWFDGIYPTFHYPHTRRSDSRDIDFHTSQPQTLQDGIDAMVEMLICAQAHTLIHPVSNMATLSLIINPQVRSHYLR